MDPIDLTCPKCGTAWKLIKAGDGPITCPNCKTPIDGGPPAAPPAVPPTPVAAAPPAVTTTIPTANVSDGDDPGISAVPRARGPIPDIPRRGRHPLVTVAVVLLLVFLVPLALLACLFAVCTVMFRGM